MKAASSHWIRSLAEEGVLRALGKRTFELALASDLGYIEAPALRGGAVHAVVGESTLVGTRAFRVELRDADGFTVSGSCSRCMAAFGACQHMGIVLVDLTYSQELRAAVLEGARTAVIALSMRRMRRTVMLERQFDTALSSWLVPPLAGVPIEISAQPDDAPPRGYGERNVSTGRAVVIHVRQKGERRLLAGSEIADTSRFTLKDRRVLEHAKDRGGGRKAAYATGVEASLLIEAMRLHQGVFGAGFKGHLRFRPTLVRPTIRFGAPPDASVDVPPDFDALAAAWISDDGTTEVPFVECTLFSGPFPFVWASDGAIYRVAHDVDLEVAKRLASAPVLYVPPGRGKDAGARLLRATRGRGVALPRHEVFGLPPVETPRLVVRLRGEPLDVVGELVAIYRGKEISLLEDDADPEDGRDLDAEARAHEWVRRAGLEIEQDEETSPRLVATGEAAIAFWQHGLAELRAAEMPTLEVELTPQLAHVRVGAPLQARVHVALEGDWLKTKLEFASDQLPVELDAVRAALERKHRWVRLDDGTLSRISASIEALADEATDVMGDKTTALLPAHQLGRLDRWIEENDGRMDAAVAALRKRLRALSVATEPVLPQGLRGTLRPYQCLGLSWLQFVRALGAGGILADDMGLGKTITALAYLLAEKERVGPMPSLVVCPTSVATNWVSEAERFTPDLSVLLLHGPSRDARAIGDHDLVITTYGLLRRDIDHLAPIRFRAVILDEAQNIKNADSATRRAATKLDSELRLALSGTPMENRLRELWSIASFVNPGILGSTRAFETRFERPITADRAAAVGAELRAIVRPFMLRRTKRDVLEELPPKTEIDRSVTLTTADKRMYDALAHSLRESVTRDIQSRKLKASSLSVFTALMRLRQMACDPRLVDPHLATARSAKREAFLDLVRELVAEGRRALVFSQFVSLLTLWRQDLDAEHIAYEYLDGSTTKRDEVVARFQNGTAPLFLISLKAGGAGLNLTAADTVIHCDPWWNPAVEDQATDRAYRLGQDKPVTVVRLVAKGTIEEKVFSLKAKKRDLVRAIISDDAQALRGMTEEDVRMLLGDADEVAEDADGADGEDESDATDMVATRTMVIDPQFVTIARRAKRWLDETGSSENELAKLIDVPVEFASRLLRREPFPCSRAVADRIAQRLREW